MSDSIAFGYKELVIADEKLSSSLLNINEKIFIQSTSKTKEARMEILEKFGVDLNSKIVCLSANQWKNCFLEMLKVVPEKFHPS